jgi:hypothetical protein
MSNGVMGLIPLTLNGEKARTRPVPKNGAKTANVV